MTSNITWVGSPETIHTGEAAAKAILTQNDNKYYNHKTGITQVDIERWNQAQKFEKQGWLECWPYAADDRSQEHLHLFNNYTALKPNLGNLIEIGCGPFTQSQTIIKNRTITHITLSDPLLESYKQLQHCPYKTGQFLNHPTTLRTEMAEHITDTETYDTLICINVLEHVQNANTILQVIHKALKKNGTLILGERTFDNLNPMESYDIGHPIHIKSCIIHNFTKQFQIIYQNQEHTGYFIGNKI